MEFFYMIRSFDGFWYYLTAVVCVVLIMAIIGFLMERSQVQAEAELMQNNDLSSNLGMNPDSSEMLPETIAPVLQGVVDFSAPSALTPLDETEAIPKTGNTESEIVDFSNNPEPSPETTPTDATVPEVVSFDETPVGEVVLPTIDDTPVNNDENPVPDVTTSEGTETEPSSDLTYDFGSSSSDTAVVPEINENTEDTEAPSDVINFDIPTVTEDEPTTNTEEVPVTESEMSMDVAPEEEHTELTTDSNVVDFSVTPEDTNETSTEEAPVTETEDTTDDSVNESENSDVSPVSDVVSENTDETSNEEENTENTEETSNEEVTTEPVQEETPSDDAPVSESGIPDMDSGTEVTPDAMTDINVDINENVPDINPAADEETENTDETPSEETTTEPVQEEVPSEDAPVSGSGIPDMDPGQDVTLPEGSSIDINTMTDESNSTSEDNN